MHYFSYHPTVPTPQICYCFKIIRAHLATEQGLLIEELVHSSSLFIRDVNVCHGIFQLFYEGTEDGMGCYISSCVATFESYSIS